MQMPAQVMLPYGLPLELYPKPPFLASPPAVVDRFSFHVSGGITTPVRAAEFKPRMAYCVLELSPSCPLSHGVMRSHASPADPAPSSGVPPITCNARSSCALLNSFGSMLTPYPHVPSLPCASSR